MRISDWSSDVCSSDLVVGAHQWRIAAVRGLLELERTEVAGQVRPPELVVERCRAQRAVEHDFQRRGHARVQRARVFPGLRQRRDAQVRDGEPAQRSEGHTYELQSLMSSSYADFSLKKKT